jgi:hypothetical protein
MLSSRIGVPGSNYLAILAYTTPTTTTDVVDLQVPFRAIVTPSVNGPATYYLNGKMTGGQDANDVFWYANMAAHVY